MIIRELLIELNIDCLIKKNYAEVLSRQEEEEIWMLELRLSLVPLG